MKKNRLKAWPSLIILIAILMLKPGITSGQSSEEKDNVTPGIQHLYNPEQLKQIRYTYNVFEIKSGQWGFEILGDEKSIVFQHYRQVTLSSGIIKDREEASAIAQLRIEKLRKGEAGPLTTSELKEINSTKN